MNLDYESCHTTRREAVSLDLVVALVIIGIYLAFFGLIALIALNSL